MNRTNYNKAKRYAWAINHEDYMDTLHDAYLVWFDKTGHDLFDEPIHRVFKIVKLTYMSKWRANQRHNVTYSTLNNEDKTISDNPEDIFIENETKLRYLALAISANYNAHDKDILSKILNQKVKGYRNNEIAENLEVSKALVTYYLNKVDQKAILN